ncbi:Hypothetical protein EUBELI_20328 (plasmid) [Lachnospira eligens ATCC 27750]|uniref:Uncharacterized protein n=1 Tax=Lachnospira eligens (strain ATCC 27750 / DSM 3376 / VPI C15-48 / C15-B4) TaxID=515620 RepID=C4Z681_LACE2|nr:Hypothetical protein EUBELI_20328 [[Eubacterium] eligens ATCC 27750]
MIKSPFDLFYEIRWGVLAIGRYAVLERLAPKTRFRSATDAADTKLVLAFDEGCREQAPASLIKIPNSLSAGVLRRFFPQAFSKPRTCD